jgi:hypothetical protein
VIRSEKRSGTTTTGRTELQTILEFCGAVTCSWSPALIGLLAASVIFKTSFARCGPVKTDEARDVVLHRQIVESGFLDFVKASGPGHLFISPSDDELGVRKAVKTARNKVNMFVREVVPDPHVDPSHR